MVSCTIWLRQSLCNNTESKNALSVSTGFRFQQQEVHETWQRHRSHAVVCICKILAGVIQINSSRITIIHRCTTDSEQDSSGTCTAAEDTAAEQTDAVERPVSPAVSAAAEPSPALENSDQSGLLLSRGTAAGRPWPRQSVHVTTTFFLHYDY